MRVKNSVSTRKRRKKLLKLAKGYVGSKGKLFRVANEQMLHSLSYSYRDRRNRKRDLKRLWITRINAKAHESGFSYNKFIHQLKIKKIELNLKMLADISFHHQKSWDLIIQKINQKS